MIKQRKQCLGLLLVLSFLLLGGCGNRENHALSGSGETKGDGLRGNTVSNQKSKVMGRYTEQELKFPDEASEVIAEAMLVQILGDSGRLELVIGIYENKSMEFYSYPVKADGSFGKSRKLSWAREALEIAEKKYQGEAAIERFCLGEDAHYYILMKCYEDSKADGKAVQLSRNRVFRYQTGEESLEEVEIPYLSEVWTEDEEIILNPPVTEIGVLKNGSIVLQDQISDQFMLFAQDGEKLMDLPISYPASGTGLNHSGGFTVRDNIICGIKNGGSSIVWVDGGTQKEIKTAKLDLDSYGIRLRILDDGTLLGINTDGIHRLKQDGEVWETVLDGELNTMGLPTCAVLGTFSSEEFENSEESSEGKKPEYFVLYQQQEGGGYNWMAYQFDESISAVPEQELTVYSLQENKAVRQAISLYQRNHRDVKIEYMVAADGGEVENTSEYIRALNVELLNGNGADLFLTDGLPVDSYIEKGLLADLGEVMGNELDALQKSVVDASKSDGAIYTLPLRMQVPIAIGGNQWQEALKSLDGMANYAEKSKEKPIMLLSGAASFLRSMLAWQEEELIQEDGSLDEEAFQLFLKKIDVLKDNGVFGDLSDPNAPGEAKQSYYTGFISNPLAMVSGEVEGCVDNVTNATSLVVADVLTKEKGISFDTLGGRFYGIGFCALNQSSENKELAGDFLRFLFSKEAQNSDLYNGFPVRTECIEEWFLTTTKMQDDMYFGFSGGDSDVSIEGGYPSKKCRKRMVDLIGGLTEMVDENTLWCEQMLEALDGYLMETKDADETLQSAKEKMRLYQAEQS